MTPRVYLALLRGINVGGRNVIRMKDLAECFEDMGFTGVVTYIQSGNVIFRSVSNGVSELASRIESALSSRFSYSSRIVLLTHLQLKHVVENAPDGFGMEPELYKYDVIFLKEPLAAAEAIKSIETREGVDAVFEGRGVVYSSRLISRVTQSRLSKITALPIYQDMTIRNWNTTTKLLMLMEKRQTAR